MSVVATLIESKSMAVLAVGEGPSAYAAKADAILNCPQANWDVPMADCEWEVLELDD